jgi:hypothetical protein
MLSLVAAVLLASAPGASSLSLLPPDAPALPSARLLVALQEQEYTPVPFPDDMREPRIRDLATRLGLIQQEINSIRLGRPRGYKAMTIVGFILTPMLLIGVPLIIAGVSGSKAERDVAWLLGTPLAIGGVVGVALVVTGFVQGGRISRANKARRDALVEERTRLEAELRELQTRDGGGRPSSRWRSPPSLPLVAVNF